VRGLWRKVDAAVKVDVETSAEVQELREMSREGKGEEDEMTLPELEALEERLEEAEAEALRFKRAFMNAFDKLVELGAVEADPHTRYLYRTGQREF